MDALKNPKSITIDVLGFRDKLCVVDSRRQLTREIEGKVFSINDYFFKIRGETESKLVRYNESQNDVLILTVRNSFGYDKVFEEIMASGRDFRIDDENKNFFRIPNISDPYIAKESDGINHTRRIRYWDFARDYEEDGVTKTEFLFVEQDMSTGWCEILVGFLVPSSMVFLI